MIIAELPFQQFNSILQSCAKKSGVELIIYLVARNADAPNLFNEIEENWTSLHDMTGNKILFVVVNGQSHKWANNRNQIQGEYGFRLYSPYFLLSSSIETLIRYEEKWFGKYVVPMNDLENPRHWRDRHNLAMSEVAATLNLSELDIPCLYFHIVTAEKNISFPLNQVSHNFSLYSFIKKIKEQNNFFGVKRKLDEFAGVSETRKYKKYKQHIQTIETIITKVDFDEATTNWIKDVVQLNTSDKNVYDKISPYHDKFDNGEFVKFRAALNSLSSMTTDTSFKTALKTKNNGTKNFAEYVRDFEILLDKKLHEEY